MRERGVRYPPYKNGLIEDVFSCLARPKEPYVRFHAFHAHVYAVLVCLFHESHFIRSSEMFFEVPKEFETLSELTTKGDEAKVLRLGR